MRVQFDRKPEQLKYCSKLPLSNAAAPMWNVKCIWISKTLSCSLKCKTDWKFDLVTISRKKKRVRGRDWDDYFDIQFIVQTSIVTKFFSIRADLQIKAEKTCRHQHHELELNITKWERRTALIVSMWIWIWMWLHDDNNDSFSTSNNK